MTYISQNQLKSLAESANTAAAYLDACDNGAKFTHLDPAYYQSCAHLLTTVFDVVDPKSAFPDLIKQSPAARNALESIEMERRLSISSKGYFPELAATLARAAV